MDASRRSARTSACCADELTRRLRARFAPDGLLHYGLGKWYPGEAMPRWAFALYWRRDGKPMWRDAALIAREGDKARAERGGCAAPRRGDRAAARHRGGARAAGLRGPAALDGRRGQASGQCRRARSETVRCRGARPHDARVRARARDTGRLRAAAAPRGDAWASEAWELRREHLFLLPGDLPVGSRLPLASLPRVEPTIRSSRSRPDGARRRPCPIAAAEPKRGRRRDRAHRARGRAARRPAQRVHAVRRHARGLSRRRSPRSRRRPPRSSCRCTSRATRRRSIRASRSSR